MPTTIINYNKEIINFLDNANYGMSKPQLNINYPIQFHKNVKFLTKNSIIYGLHLRVLKFLFLHYTKHQYVDTS